MSKDTFDDWHTVAINWDSKPSDKVEFHFVAEDGHHRQTIRMLPDGGSEVIEDVITPLKDLRF